MRDEGLRFIGCDRSVRVARLRRGGAYDAHGKGESAEPYFHRSVEYNLLRSVIDEFSVARPSPSHAWHLSGFAGIPSSGGTFSHALTHDLTDRSDQFHRRWLPWATLRRHSSPVFLRIHVSKLPFS